MSPPSCAFLCTGFSFFAGFLLMGWSYALSREVIVFKRPKAFFEKQNSTCCQAITGAAVCYIVCGLLSMVYVIRNSKLKQELASIRAAHDESIFAHKHTRMSPPARRLAAQQYRRQLQATTGLDVHLLDPHTVSQRGKNAN